MHPFGQQLKEMVIEAGYKKEMDFVRALPARSSSQSSVNRALKGTHAIPEGDEDDWYDLLAEQAARRGISRDKFKELNGQLQLVPKKTISPTVAGLWRRIHRAEVPLLEAIALLEEAEKRSGGSFKVPARLRQAVNAIRKDRELG